VRWHASWLINSQKWAKGREKGQGLARHGRLVAMKAVHYVVPVAELCVHTTHPAVNRDTPVLNRLLKVNLIVTQKFAHKYREHAATYPASLTKGLEVVDVRVHTKIKYPTTFYKAF